MARHELGLSVNGTTCLIPCRHLHKRRQWVFCGRAWPPLDLPTADVVFVTKHRFWRVELRVYRSYSAVRAALTLRHAFDHVLSRSNDWYAEKYQAKWHV